MVTSVEVTRGLRIPFGSLLRQLGEDNELLAEGDDDEIFL